MSYIVILMSFTAIFPSIGYDMSNYALNRDGGAYLPEEYMHLIGR
jgi:hypothetical protein